MMKQHTQKLDSLFKQAKDTTPYIQHSEAERFVSMQTGQAATQVRRGMPLSHRPILATGGFMIVVAALLLLLNPIAPQMEFGQQEAEPRHAIGETKISIKPRNHVLEDITYIRAATDDSVARAHETDAYQPRNTVDGMSASPVSNSDCESSRDEHHRLNEIFAHWTKERVNGVNILELQPSEYNEIGVWFGKYGEIYHIEFSHRRGISGMKEYPDSSVQYSIGLRYPLPASLLLRRERDSASASRKPASVDVDSMAYLNLYAPVLITNTNGRIYLYRVPEACTKSRIQIGDRQYPLSDLVAIRVEPQVDAEWSSFSYIFWYTPEPEFLAQLSEQTRTLYERSRQIRPDSLHNGASPLPSLAATVHPNPVTQSQATIEYTLPSACRVAVSMYDVTGQRIRDLSVSEEKEEGTWQEQLELEDVPNGLYLLAVTTDRGEQSVQPIMVKR